MDPPSNLILTHSYSGCGCSFMLVINTFLNLNSDLLFGTCIMLMTSTLRLMNFNEPIMFKVELRDITKCWLEFYSRHLRKILFCLPGSWYGVLPELRHHNQWNTPSITKSERCWKSKVHRNHWISPGKLQVLVPSSLSTFLPLSIPPFFPSVLRPQNLVNETLPALPPSIPDKIVGWRRSFLSRNFILIP